MPQHWAQGYFRLDALSSLDPMFMCFSMTSILLQSSSMYFASFQIWSWNFEGLQLIWGRLVKFSYRVFNPASGDAFSVNLGDPWTRLNLVALMGPWKSHDNLILFVVKTPNNAACDVTKIDCTHELFLPSQWRCELTPTSQWAHLNVSPWG